MRKTYPPFLLGIIFFFLILTISLFLLSFNTSFYKKEFSRYHVYEQFTEPQTKIDQEFSYVLSYLQGKTTTLETPFFNEKEKIHLNDVKELYTFARIILYISLFLFLLLSFFLFKNKQPLLFFQGITYGSIFLLLFFFILFIFVLVNFEKTFTLFHKLLFTNDLWMLNPETDNLIKMLPLEIFQDLAKRIIIFSVLAALFFGYGSIYFKKKLLLKG